MSYRLAVNTLTPTGAMTGSATIYSQSFQLGAYQEASFLVTWTGTPTGTLSVEVSNDGSTWADLGASVVNQPAGSASQVYIPVYGCCAMYMRLKYVNSGGSGVLGGTIAGKTR